MPRTRLPFTAYVPLIGMRIDLLEFIGLVITGFTSRAEFGSYAFVHPVIRRLPREHHVSVEKGLLGDACADDALCRPFVRLRHAAASSAGYREHCSLGGFARLPCCASLHLDFQCPN
jgi:hypothetical protein